MTIFISSLQNSNFAPWKREFITSHRKRKNVDFLHADRKLTHQKQRHVSGHSETKATKNMRLIMFIYFCISLAMTFASVFFLVRDIMMKTITVLLKFQWCHAAFVWFQDNFIYCYTVRILFSLWAFIILKKKHSFIYFFFVIFYWFKMQLNKSSLITVFAKYIFFSL